MRNFTFLFISVLSLIICNRISKAQTIDVAITATSPYSDAIIPNGTIISPAATVFNNGTAPITTLTLYYSDGTNTYSDTQTGLNIAPSQYYLFWHNTFYTITPGINTITLWTDLAGDNNHSNDSMAVTFQGSLWTPNIIQYLKRQQAPGVDGVRKV